MHCLRLAQVSARQTTTEQCLALPSRETEKEREHPRGGGLSVSHSLFHVIIPHPAISLVCSPCVSSLPPFRLIRQDDIETPPLYTPTSIYLRKVSIWRKRQEQEHKEKRQARQDEPDIVQILKGEKTKKKKKETASLIHLTRCTIKRAPPHETI